MKNIFYKIGVVCFMAIGLVSCEDENSAVLNPDNTQNLWSFNQTATEFAVNNEVFVDTIEVGVTSRADVDRIIPVIIDAASSTATNAQYSIDASSLVIPAGEFIGRIIITANADNLPDGETFIINMMLDDSQVEILDEKMFHTVNLFKSCATEDLSGDHTYEQYNILAGDGAGNGSPVPNTTSGTVTWNAAGNGVYRTSDSSFGMYTEVYGDPAGENATNPVNIRWTCQGIVTTGVDVYGDAVVYTVTQVNGPVLTLTWSSAYGDGGTVELTREGGEDWPDGLVTQ